MPNYSKIGLTDPTGDNCQGMAEISESENEYE